MVFGVACLGVLLEGFLPPRLRPQLQPVVAVLGFAAALGCVVSLSGTHELTAAGAVAIDGPALFIEGALVLFGMVSVLLFAERKADPDGGALVADAATLPGQGTHRLAARNSQTEAYPLMVFAVAGMMLFAASNNLLVMFVALEILSLPLYLLSGLARRRRLLSQEAALKYFLLGAFSSAFFLYGVAMLYGYSGSVSLQGIAAVERSAGQDRLLPVFGSRSARDRAAVQDRGCPLPRLDTRRVPGCPHPGDGVHVGGHQDRCVRGVAARPVRLVRAHRVGLAARRVAVRDTDHGRGRDRCHHPT